MVATAKPDSSPLVTVSGDLCNYLLGGQLAAQISADLGRESIEWHRSYDNQPKAVYVEANLVLLDEKCHLLSELAAVKPERKVTAKSAGTTVKRHHSLLIQRNSLTGTNTSSSVSGDESEVNTGLFRLLAQRSQLANGARVLLHSYWIDSSGQNLESYNRIIRDPLIHWFSLVLANAAHLHRAGFNRHFELDFCVVIMHRAMAISSGDSGTGQKNTEQLLSLDRLGQNKKGLGAAGLSSSLSSLNTPQPVISGSTQLNRSQLADQIRNDLLVSFQLFRQNHLDLPVTNAHIANLLMERVVIFDSTSNSSSLSSSTAATLPVPQQSSSTQNPLISSTAKTFSALSNFSSGSIKMTPGSPSKHAKGRNSSSSAQPIATPSLNYSQFVSKLRQFLLYYYEHQFDHFDKLIRQMRDLRQKTEWDYFGFFILQEEQALAFEDLGLYSRALIQYDELDALFSQLILNAQGPAGVGAWWLQQRLVEPFKSDDDQMSGLPNPLATTNAISWTGLCLCNAAVVSSLRAKIVSCVLNQDHISLLDFRNYLFARQCHLLCMLNQPWQLASRALPFLQNCVTELNLLEITIAKGGIACWVFLSVLEILHQCERYSDSSQLDSYSYHTVGLWSYAREQLAELGKLCNLMPGYIDQSADNSLHLHRMVELVAGMGADPHIRQSTPDGADMSLLSPQERLKDSLSSSEQFLKHYLEITELTMGTYKHIGHIRSARLVGKEMAELYLKLSRPQQALPFLLDLGNMFHRENWPVLRHESLRLLASCLKQLYFSAFDSLDASSTSLNLEATVRSAFRTYLSLYVQMEKTPEASQYQDSLRRLFEHHQKHGIKLGKLKSQLTSPGLSRVNPMMVLADQPLLAVHNSISDLTKEATGTPSSPESSNSSLASNQVISQKIAAVVTRQDHNQCLMNIEQVHIQCESNHLSSPLSAPSEHSFIAGSLLQMRLRLVNHMTISLHIVKALVSLECTQENLVPRAKLTDSNEHILDLAHRCRSSLCQCTDSPTVPAILETYTSANAVGLRCLNVNQVLLTGRAKASSLRFQPQLPVSLLNQRLSNDDNNQKYYRFLSAPFWFELPTGKSELNLKPGVNNVNLCFQTPSQFSQLTKHLNLSEAGHLSHLWFNPDQLVLLCQMQPDDMCGQDDTSHTNSIQFCLIEDFSFSPTYSSSFRVVKCPPMVELEVAHKPPDHKYHCISFIGIDQVVYLRINSGTSVLPKGLRCSVAITPVSPSDKPFDPDLIQITLHSEDNKIFTEFVLDRQLEPFENYQITLRLKSSYRKSKWCRVERKWSPVEDFAFRLMVGWHEEDNIEPTMTQCHFNLHEPYRTVVRVHTSAQRKYLQLGVVGVEQLPPKVVLHFEQPRLEVGSQRMKPMFTVGAFDLIAKQQWNFVWEIDHEHDVADLLNLFLTWQCIKGFEHLSNGDSDKHLCKYDLRLSGPLQTRFLIRQWIEPITKSNKNSELLRTGHRCLLHLQIEMCAESPEGRGEFIMYEVVCPSDLWILLANQEVDSEDEMPESSGPAADSAGASRVVRFTRDESLFEACFEVAPQIAGYIPLPSVRISKYEPPEPVPSPVPAESTSEQPLSLTKLADNWSKLITSSPRAQTDSNKRKSARLVPFESGQVYNYYRANQVYVLPATSTGVE